MIVTTRYISNAAGRSQVVARATGAPKGFDGTLTARQRTHNVDLSKSAEWNHGAAAGLLLVDKYPHIVAQGFFNGPIDHDSNDAGGTHKFTL